jgi:hypothetical protein
MASNCDILGRVVDIGAPMSADGIRMIIPDIGGEDHLVQQVAIQYQQNINRLWEVGSAKTFFVAGRTQGQLQIKRILGPNNGSSGSFIAQYGNVCNIASNHFTLAAAASCVGACGVPSPAPLLSCSGCVISSVGYSISAADMLINEDITMLIARLEKVA